MAIAITSIGAKVSYAVETTAGTRPTDSFSVIPGITEIPEMNPTPDMLDTTSLDNMEYTSSVPGLKTLDVLTFTARFSQELFDLYTTKTTGLMDSYKTAKKDGKGMWLCIDIPGLTHACYVKVEPTNIGMPSASANSVIDINLYFAPVGEPEWVIKKTT